MRRDNLSDMVWNILQDMYAEADPPMDFKVECAADRLHGEWYARHVLSEERQQAIVKKHVDRKRLNRLDQSALGMAMLNWSPKYGE